MQKCSFSPKIPSKDIIYNPYSFVLAKTAPRSNVVCQCLPKSSNMDVVANTKGEEMMTSCCRTASFASCACYSALSLHQVLIPWKDRGGESLTLANTHALRGQLILQKKTVAKIRRTRVRRCECKTVTKCASQCRTVTEAHHECQL